MAELDGLGIISQESCSTTKQNKQKQSLFVNYKISHLHQAWEADIKMRK